MSSLPARWNSDRNTLSIPQTQFLQTQVTWSPASASPTSYALRPAPTSESLQEVRSINTLPHERVYTTPVVPVQRAVHWEDLPQETHPDYRVTSALAVNPFFEKATKHDIDVLRMFPSRFALCGLLLFLPPSLLLAHLCHDTTVQYWVGYWTLVPVLIPFIFITSYIVHQSLGKPHKPTILICLFTSCVLLFAIGDIILSVSSDKGAQLLSMDCDSFPAKRQLQKSWEAAAALFDKCLVDTVQTHNITLETARSKFRIQDCEEYAVQLDMHGQDWNYLQQLEEQYQCSGWCASSASIWAFKAQSAQDSCHTVVAQVFFHKVHRSAKQVVVYTIVTLLAISIVLVLIGPLLRANGLEW